MDAQSIIETLQRDVKDKTLLVRFYNLKNGADIWIDGLCWAMYDFDMKDYLHEEFGIELEGDMTFDVMDADSDFIQRTCFNKGVFSLSTYEKINEALVTHSEEAIEAALVFSINLDVIEDAYCGKYSSFVAFCEQRFNELDLPNIPQDYHKFIDYEKVADDWEQYYHYHEGHVFDATVG